jgi:hypothetical protein
LPGPEAAAAKALNLEKMLGADRAGRTVVVPKDTDPPEAWGEVFNKLGRPADPAGYGLPLPEGADPKFAQEVGAWFHTAGLTRAQAQSVASKWNEYATAQATQAQQAEQEALRVEHERLKADWGGAFGVQTEIAKRAALKLGLDEQAIDALQKVAGFSKTMKALAKAGEAFGEDKALGVGDGTGLMTTPEAARGRKAQLMADKEWAAKARSNPNSAEFAELTRLNRIIAEAEQQAA